ncbi:MAG: histidinol dehydrogenase [Deferribacteraceae bacterium]|jgi:histidinol dehydrogenase|nr:histidinol dehydrogenase [Deferribacteraceae bacterium]
MIINRNDPNLQKIIRRGEYFEKEYLPKVLEILENVKNNGDSALLEYTKRFDRFDPAGGFEVSEDMLKNALNALPPDLKYAMTCAKERITVFHEKQREKSWLYDDNGILLGQKVTPLERVGVYVPGGSAAYPSSVLMNIIPAKVAGVKEIIMVTPAPEGKVNHTALAAAELAGADRVFLIGGAHAVGAMAYGTQTVPKTDKIVGPGNIYVALAKKMVFGTVDIDMIAGPSEILIIADETATPAYVAADMLSQAEHDELASAVAIVTSNDMAERVKTELNKQLKLLPRKDTAEKSLNRYAAIVVVKDVKEACEVSDAIAPEHLELCVAFPMETARLIHNAGAIFMGHYTPEAVGDYFAGSNHVLPTGGTARFFSPLGVYDFIKRSALICYDSASLKAHGEMIKLLAETEGLSAHSRSISVRE